MSHFAEKLQQYQEKIDQALLRFLPDQHQHPTRLHEAMHYVTFNGGKRIRPILVYATGHALGTETSLLDAPAAAVEMIHAYSLVHDDLPAMDDDDLRRGKPTCHKAFDEATAILAGDALNTLAFELLSDENSSQLACDQRLKIIHTLSSAAGHFGMVGGQAIDLNSVGIMLTLDQLKEMHAKKTGALIQASVKMGAHAALASDSQIKSLTEYANAIGLAFQIRDDILDVEGDTETIGKTQGADEAKNKPTYPKLLGLSGAKQAADELHQQAMQSLTAFDQKADTLRELSEYIVCRDK